MEKVDKSFGPNLGITVKFIALDNDGGRNAIEVIKNDRGEWAVVDAGDAWCHTLKGFGGENTLNIFISRSYFQIHVMVVETHCADGAEVASS